jgi:ribosomal protein S12 methylthiotransferase accessory factor
MPKAAHVSVFRIDSLDRIGIPVAQANLLLPDEPATIGYGYGFTEDEAAVGALGELCEEVHVGAWVKRAPRTVASYAELLRARGPGGVVDPLTLCLPAAAPGRRRRRCPGWRRSAGRRAIR